MLEVALLFDDHHEPLFEAGKGFLIKMAHHAEATLDMRDELTLSSRVTVNGAHLARCLHPRAAARIFLHNVIQSRLAVMP